MSREGPKSSIAQQRGRRPKSNPRLSKRKLAAARAAARRAAMRRKKAQAAEVRRLKAERRALKRQQDQFARAAEFFNTGKFGMARRYLVKVRDGPHQALAHRARIYLAICKKKKFARKRVKLETIEDFYNYGVKLVNDGKFADAVRVLNRGLSKDKTAAHLHYIKAVAKVLAGQSTGAIIPLKKAIALEPEIRILALKDPDLQSVIHRYPFSDLVSGENS